MPKRIGSGDAFPLTSPRLFRQGGDDLGRDLRAGAEEHVNRADLARLAVPAREARRRALGRYGGHALDIARDCVLEIVLKDTHTCEHHPERFDDWTRIAREAIDGLAQA